MPIFSSADRPAFVSSSRPVSFCPTPTPSFRIDPSVQQAPAMSYRRFSEIPIQLDTKFCFGEAITDAFTSACHYSSPNLHVTPHNSYRLPHCSGSSVSRQSTYRAISSTDASSCTSSAFTAPTSPVVDSDGASSIYDYTVDAFDFPEPPPISSPVIRKMRSSPWFLTADEAADVLAVPAWRGRAFLPGSNDMRQSLRTSPPRPWAASALERRQGRSRWSARSADLGKSFHPHDPVGFPKSQTTMGIHHANQMNQAFSENRGCELSNRRNSTLMDVKGIPQSLSVTRNEATKMETQSSPSPFERLPRIIRKVASMRSETQRVPHVMANNIQRPIPKVRSFRSLLRASEEQAQTHVYSKQYLNKENAFQLGQKNSQVPRARPQSNLYASNSSSRTLAPPSTYPASWKDDVNKSFIDISPERGARSKNKSLVGKGKVKSLFSKANGIFSWGRSQKKAVTRGEQPT